YRPFGVCHPLIFPIFISSIFLRAYEGRRSDMDLDGKETVRRSDCGRARGVGPFPTATSRNDLFPSGAHRSLALTAKGTVRPEQKGNGRPVSQRSRSRLR